MTTYFVTGKVSLNRKTGKIRGCIPAKQIDKIVSNPRTPRGVRKYWEKRISKPIKSTKLRCLFKRKNMCDYYGFDQGNKLIKIEKPK